MDPSIYDEDYFIRGKESGKSLYTDYRWLPDLTLPMAQAIATHLEIPRGDSVLDFGCARGYLVKALKILGYKARGYDVSQWVIDHCDPDVAGLVSSDYPKGVFDWVLAKDVLEHIDTDALAETVHRLAASVRKGLFIVVPLSPKYGEKYVVPEYEQDVTHQIRMSLADWAFLVRQAVGEDWFISCRYRVDGVKDNYYTQYPLGNGFITARRS